MTPATIGNFLLNNPVAQRIALAGVALALFWFWLIRHDSKIRAMERKKAEIRTRNTIRTIEREAHETVERIQEDQRTYTAPDNAGELPDALRTVIIK